MFKRKMKNLVAVVKARDESTGHPVFNIVPHRGLVIEDDTYLIPQKFAKLIKSFKEFDLIPDELSITNNVFTIRLVKNKIFSARSEKLIEIFSKILSDESTTLVQFNPVTNSNNSNTLYGANPCTGEYTLSFDFYSNYLDISEDPTLKLFSPLYTWDLMYSNIKRMTNMISRSLKKYEKLKKKSKKK